MTKPSFWLIHGGTARDDATMQAERQVSVWTWRWCDNFKELTAEPIEAVQDYLRNHFRLWANIMVMKTWR